MGTNGAFNTKALCVQVPPPTRTESTQQVSGRARAGERRLPMAHGTDPESHNVDRLVEVLLVASIG